MDQLKIGENKCPKCEDDFTSPSGDQTRPSPKFLHVIAPA